MKSKQLLLTWASAYVSGTMTSHASGFPLDHGRIVVPSGRLPSCRSRPTGSLTAGNWSLFMTRQIMSLRYENLLFAFATGQPWSSRTSTTFPQPHVCSSHALQPSLWATDILSRSSDSCRPTDAIGGAASQSPECGDAAASSLALSMSVEAWDQTSCSCFLQTMLSHALWICTDSVAGVEFPDKDIHLVSAIEMELSPLDLVGSGRKN